MTETWEGRNGERYYLRYATIAPFRVTQEVFITAERSAGFFPKGGRGVATGGFSTGPYRGHVLLTPHARKVTRPTDDGTLVAECSCGGTYSIQQGNNALARLELAHAQHVTTQDLEELS